MDSAGKPFSASPRFCPWNWASRLPLTMICTFELPRSCTLPSWSTVTEGTLFRMSAAEALLTLMSFLRS
jgi:hypothetical protein